MSNGANIDHQQAILGLLDILATDAAPEMSLAKVCQTLVRAVSDFKFAAYSLEDEEVWHIPCAQEGFKVHYAPMDIERSFVRFIKGEVTRLNPMAFDESKVRPFIPESCRDVWSCHSCLAFAVCRENRRLAVVILFLCGDILESQQESYLQLIRIASLIAGAVCSLWLLTAENNDFQKRIQDQQLELKTVRLAVRDYLHEFERLKHIAPEKTISYADLQPLVLQGAAELVRLADSESESQKACVDAAFCEPAFMEWVSAGFGDSRVKVIVGLRGTGKSKALRAIMALLRARGVSDSRMVFIDFGDALTWRFKKMTDVLDYLRALPDEGLPRHLFVNEISRIGWHAKLLRHLGSLENWNVWAASSTSGAVGGGEPFMPYTWVSIFRVWSRPNVPRPRSILRMNWNQIFLRDLDAGVAHNEIRAKEALAGYYSDHLGELNPLREIALEMNARGCEISTNTIRAYRRSLESVYLIEVTDVYDVFEGRVVKNCCGRVFWTDLDLRTWRFGRASDYEDARVAMNVLYLQLRKTYANVYTPHNQAADFVTIEKNGACRYWTTPIADAVAAQFLRAHRGGGGVNRRK